MFLLINNFSYSAHSKSPTLLKRSLIIFFSPTIFSTLSYENCQIICQIGLCKTPGTFRGKLLWCPSQPVSLVWFSPWFVHFLSSSILNFLFKSNHSSPSLPSWYSPHSSSSPNPLLRKGKASHGEPTKPSISNWGRTIPFSPASRLNKVSS